MKFIFTIIFLFINTYFCIAGEVDLNTRVDCAAKAALNYGIPVDILLAISSIENGEIGKAYKNPDGSYDYGVMQINTIYIKDLKNNYNIEILSDKIMNDVCYAFNVAAFKIKEHLLQDNGEFLQKIANYHSKTLELNRNYQTKIIEHSASWRKFLTKNKYEVYAWSYTDIKNIKEIK